MLADQIPSLDLFPSQRIRQISLRTHDLDEEFILRNSLLSMLIRHLHLLRFRPPTPEIIDLSAGTSRRFTRVVFHRDLVRYRNYWPKLLKVAIYGELYSV